MFNMLRMDMRRMLRGKSFLVCLGILVFTTILTFLLLWMITDPAMHKLLTENGFTITVSDQEVVASAGIDILNLFHQTNLSGGMFAVVTGILAVLFTCSDFESGFAKNIFSVCDRRFKYLLSKFICMCAVNLIYLAGTLVLALLINLAAGTPFAVNSAGEIIFFLASVWALENAFSALVLMVCMISRNKAAGITAAIIVCGGVVSMVLGTGLSLFGLGWIMDYSIYMQIANSLFAYAGVASLKVFGIAAVYIVLYLAVGQGALSRKDI